MQSFSIKIFYQKQCTHVHVHIYIIVVMFNTELSQCHQGINWCVMIYRNKSSIQNVATAILGGVHPHTAIPRFPGDVTDPDQTAEHVLRHSIVSSRALLGLRVPTAKSHKAHSHRISKNFFIMMYAHGLELSFAKRPFSSYFNV